MSDPVIPPDTPQRPEPNGSFVVGQCCSGCSNPNCPDCGEGVARGDERYDRPVGPPVPEAPERPEWSHPAPQYLFLDIWCALGGDCVGFDAWIADDPRRTPADSWAQLMGAIRGDRAALEADTNPPAGALLGLLDLGDYGAEPVAPVQDEPVVSHSSSGPTVDAQDAHTGDEGRDEAATWKVGDRFVLADDFYADSSWGLSTDTPYEVRSVDGPRLGILNDDLDPIGIGAQYVVRWRAEPVPVPEAPPDRTTLDPENGGQ
jgi:hypothetical protein